MRFAKGVMLMPQTRSVLIVDDDVVLARAFARGLSDEGYGVHAVHSAEDALREILTNPPDLIILDFRMPRINGVGFLYRLRSQPAHLHTPVLFVTGEAQLSEEIKDELQSLGAEVCLKPIGLKELVTTTRRLLSRAPNTTELHLNVSRPA